MVDNPSIRLTQTVKKGGCASKLPAQELQSILQQLTFQSSSQLLVDSHTWDDAAVWDLSSNKSHALVQTLDFFTPIVDDPYDFGRITAANAMSDVYAMGGRPQLALCILAFPTKTLDAQILKPLMQGALDMIHQGKAILAGGHTIDDETLKLGFAVTGFVPKKNFWSNAKAQTGDILVLTKPLGVGTLVAAHKKHFSKQTQKWLKGAIDSMIQLNNVVDFLPLENVHAATDITGFGLLGHAYQMAKASQVSFQLDAHCIPQLPGTMMSLQQGNLVKAHYTNAQYVQDFVSYRGIPENIKHLLNDPQTSGGLLLAIGDQQISKVLPVITAQFPQAKVIGKVIPQESHFLIID